MNLKELEAKIVGDALRRFREFPITELYDAIGLTPDQLEKTKKFIEDFARLTEEIEYDNRFLHDFKTIFLATMISVIRGPKDFLSLVNCVTVHMMPKTMDDLITAKNVMNEMIKLASPEVNISNEVKKIMDKLNPHEPENLTNVKDENGNRMTIDQLMAESENEVKN